MAVNQKQGLQQDLPADELNGTEWFENGNLSFLKTPQNRKSCPILPRLHESVADDESEYVVHSVQTEVSFDLGTLMAFAAQRGALFSALDNTAIDDTPSLRELPSVPFSAIRASRSKRSLFNLQERFSLDDDEEDTENADPFSPVEL